MQPERTIVVCRKCSGLKREACSRCRGQGFHARAASAARHDGHLDCGIDRVACAPCFGVGYVPCTRCGGRGRVVRETADDALRATGT